MKKNRILSNLLRLCSVPSISETNGEIDIAHEIYKILNEINYFKNNPEMVKVCPMNGDPYNRSFVYALMKSEKKNSKTIILLSHFDVVGIEDFGILKELAFDPIAYTQKLKDNSQIQMSEEARADLESGDYLFGRGIMDMKFGIAADIEILYTMEKELSNFEGNLLFLSVPDEEANSAGMLAAVELLESLKKEQQLEYSCCLVSEPHFPKYPKDDTKYIYTGTVGKLLPSFYCVGKETHVCEPFSGLNANRLTAKLIENIDSNPELSDYVMDTIVPPPACLKQADTKIDYSVQTPTSAYTYFNYMTLVKTPQEVMQSMINIAESSFKEVLSDIRTNIEKLSESTGEILNIPNIEPKVITFQELYKLCYKTHGDKFQLHLKKFIDNQKSNQDLRDLSIEIVKEAHKFCPYRNPIIVVFYSPPFYPHSDIQNLDNKVIQVSKHIVKFAKQKFNETIKIEPFFMGLSDMSYLGLSKNVDITQLTNNFPIWDMSYHVPLETIAKLNIPFINVGPLGKDAHKYTERICMSYSFEKAADIILEAVLSLLKLD
ncbi:M20/M25/M40 family metallo-hydrolase [Anaerovorax odorimutans]|uniref:M20/M25/M40 family metallo-hydrolase n=1 Tax=Anaerovorax odorimutans TaxID=109327 RepID=UPI000412FEC4|nr:M20/M25/M40 family metallo-hydrolase [Anaerovorax odorimutans]